MQSDMQERHLTILYASQTGTAEDVAHRISHEAQNRRFHVQVQSMADADASTLVQERCVIFVVATTGDGKEPDSMREYWQYLLRKKHPAHLLQSLRMAVFGLGDSSYEKYNYAGRKLHKRLLQLGATSIVARGEGDDQHYLAVEGGLDPWLVTLWETLLHLYPLPAGEHILPDDTLHPPPYQMHFLETPFEVDDVLLTPYRVTRNDRITEADHFQDVRHIELELPTDGPAWRPGDAIEFLPENDAADVDAALRLLDWYGLADKCVEITPTHKDHHRSPLVPAKCTLRRLLEAHLDPFATPKSTSTFFRVLAHFATDATEKAKLQEFCTPGEGTDEARAYLSRPKRTRMEVLQDFSSVKLPPERCWEVFGLLRGRKYSASRIRSAHNKTTLDLTVAVVDYKTTLKKARHGVATKWLKSVAPFEADAKRRHFRHIPGDLCFPTDPSAPFILVATGTGMAPFRAYLHHRIAAGQSLSPGVLIYGFRSAQKDALYEKEMQAWAEQGLTIHKVASRDREEALGRRWYVQDEIKAQSATLGPLLLQAPTVCICGNASQMPKAVQDAFVHVLAQTSSLDMAGAEQFIMHMKRDKKYQVEAWS